MKSAHDDPLKHFQAYILHIFQTNATNLKPRERDNVLHVATSRQ